MGKLVDMTGKRCGMVVVLERSYIKNKMIFYKCLCDCGNTVNIGSGSLKSKIFNSCGCYKARKFGDRMRKHGVSNTKLYGKWIGMKNRCYSESGRNYKNYGGRGIKVCDEWLYSLESFIKWAKSNGYINGLTLDRKDTDGDYTPDNCRFITNKEQQSNKRNNIKIEIDGVTDHVTNWCKKYAISRTTLMRRFRKNGNLKKELLKMIK